MILALSPFGFDVPLPVVILGMIIGLTYGLLAVGLVLIYRSNRIINFAHGEIGVFSATVFGVAVTRWSVPYYLGLPLALGLGAAVGAVSEIAVVRRLRNAPRIMSIVATLGVGQFLVFLGAVVSVQATSFSFPQPVAVPVFDLGPLRVTQAYSAMLLFAPIVVIALILFLRRSRYGIAMRAAPANPEAARMSGIWAGRMSSLAWALAGAVSAFTAILVLPSQGFTSGESFGPSLLLRALAGAVLARMTSLPVALAGGMALGIVEQLLLWNYPQAGFVEISLFLIILVGLLVQKSTAGRDEERGSWIAVQSWRPVPDALRKVWVVRHLATIVGLIALATAASLPLFVTNSTAVILIGIMGFSMVGLSVGVLTGLAGQLSLGQFAVAGLGATVSFHVSSRIGNFPLAFLYAGLAAAAGAVLVGLPALRLRGLMVTVTTLSFALVVPSWLLTQPWALNDGHDPGRPIFFGRPLDTGHSYYFVALLMLTLLTLLARNLRNSSFGRLLVAVRDNEDNARAFTVSARLVKMQAFLVAGFIAGVGGAVYGHTFSQLSGAIFPTRASIDVVAMTVIGGMSLLSGPLLGAMYIIGIPSFLPLDSAGLAATQLGWLILILYVPGGLAQLVEPLRDRLILGIGRLGGVSLSDLRPSELAENEATLDMRSAPMFDSNAAIRAGASHRPAGTTLLRAERLRKHFGGIVAVNDVSFDVESGEILGLIGPNGAGKTTTFEILGGFTRPDRGTVHFDGQDISALTPEARARIGLIRSFQDAALFPTMSVLECVMLSLERSSPTSLLRSALGLRKAERARELRARELVALMGLEVYRDRQVQELSTGTRRITEIACLVALEPTLLLLDEPSSGIAQRETEALGALLSDLRQQLDLTMIVIEHDIPLIMGLADRIVAMDAGAVLTVGSPSAVRSDQRVVDAYLGGSITAIERSGPAGSADRAPKRRRQHPLAAR